jgi:hypothetical protein
MAGVTLVSAYFQNDLLALGLCLSLLALLIVGRVFGYDETILFFRYIQAMSNLLAATSGIMRTQLAVDRMARTQGVGPIHHWNELVERVEAMGGLELEFVCHDEAGSELCHLNWFSPQAAQTDGSAWKFQYTVPASDGIQARLVTHGRLYGQPRGQRLVDLFRLFDTFCRAWIKAVSSGAADETDPSIIAFPGTVRATEKRAASQATSSAETAAPTRAA